MSRICLRSPPLVDEGMRLRGGCHTARKKEEYERMGERVTKALIRAGAGWRFLDSSPAVYMYADTQSHTRHRNHSSGCSSQTVRQRPPRHQPSPPSGTRPGFSPALAQFWVFPARGGQWSEKGRSGQGAQVCCELSEFSCAGAR